MSTLKELRDLSIAELRKREQELDEEVVRLRLRRGTGQLSNPMVVRQARRTLARVKTLIQQHETEGTTE